ncbi:hypothetical protein DL238_10095 [Alteriqipengyuania lutimaris]|uniref:DUF4261 domain-containing protein n=2 Tax=Alteriqipengyuania lutimaris TaxID=1538146 RepID=A0A395LLS8_9SPHN|nr:hypothetical protein DL238_10095 [Alteriqipengyuania lutimaris]
MADDLLILFPHGRRPTASQIRQRCDSADFLDSCGPVLFSAAAGKDITAPDGLSLQRAGLSFDLLGLAPGAPVPVPQMGADVVAQASVLPSRTEASVLRPGPHIAAGTGDLTILREWFGLAHGLALSFDGSVLCWAPGAVILGVKRFGDCLDAWDARGDVPVALLASFRRTLDGALQSQGLAFFTGQEFRIEPQLIRGDEDALARLLFRHLFYAGRQEESGQLAAPDGVALRLEPSENRRFVRVWPG